MSSSRHPHRPTPARPPLAAVADLVHRTSDRSGPPLLVGLAFEPADLAVGTWPVPGPKTDPLTCLVGWRAPQAWDALALTAGVATGDAVEHPASVTVLVDRRNRVRVVAEVAGDEPRTTDAGSGPVVDGLRRALGLPTDPPVESPAAWVEARWLHDVATRAVARPGTVGWDEIAPLHPLAGGVAEDPETLAMATLTTEQFVTWSGLRVRLAGSVATAVHPPGGRRVPNEDWFDDGAFARWLIAEVPTAGDIREVVLATVSTDVADRVSRALVTT